MLNANNEKLSDLEPGQEAKIKEVLVIGAQRRRLFDLGFLPGTRVVAEMRAPLGEPTAYRIRAALVALRRDVSDLILVERLGEEKA
jgi:Fe2+ transport system protein FeoA